MTIQIFLCNCHVGIETPGIAAVNLSQFPETLAAPEFAGAGSSLFLELGTARAFATGSVRPLVQQRDQCPIQATGRLRFKQQFFTRI